VDAGADATAPDAGAADGGASDTMPELMPWPEDEDEDE
jgi:hypothetical protein